MASNWLLRLIILFVICLVESRLTSSVSVSEALIKLKQSFTNASALGSWSPGSVPCKGGNGWIGLVCSNGMVTGLRLGNMGLSGTIDVDALVNISGLRAISFAYNSFSGNIPEFSRLGRLKALFLSGNQFSGEIPSDFFSKMDTLKKLWLSNNKFTGHIPMSLVELSSLMELRLDKNQFTGAVPAFKQPSLLAFNVSNNNLEGEIPASLGRFPTSSFEGNTGLCGGRYGKACVTRVKALTATSGPMGSNVTKANHDHHNQNLVYIKKSIIGIVILAVLLLSVAILIVFKMRAKEEDFESAREDNAAPEEAVEVQVSMLTTPPEMAVTKKAGSSRRGSNHGRHGGNVGEFVMVNDEKGVFGLPDLMKAAAEVIGNGGSRSAYKAVMASGLAVLVKRMRDMNGMGKEGFETEITKLAKLRHINILTPLAFHYRADEKLLIYEFVPKGSLHHLLHDDHGLQHAELDWPARLKIVIGIARGLNYLHTELPSYDLPHGNLKSSNILITLDNEPLVSEFGFGPLLNRSVIAQAMLGYKAPEVSQTGVSPKCDVYCLGILILEILTGKRPCQYLSTGDGGKDIVERAESAISKGRESELLDPEISRSTSSLEGMVWLLHIGVACTETDPEKRLDVREALQRIEEIQLPSHRDGYEDS
ncbi:hypothetical protein K2173_024396 [Erythroxylum novogranatense]|uniref:Protein kinase domain-containing protein n=1 Tax=Erythroxylum novogranatense TaxID=1862640 RepID=A0AAV8SV21_9ROSI|nr:hypothetical protein K2173_024396 [Erythroxylum novogranatense]